MDGDAANTEETSDSAWPLAGGREDLGGTRPDTASVAGLFAAILIFGYWLFLSMREVSFDSIIDGFTYIQISLGDQQPLGYDTDVREPVLLWILGLAAPLRSARLSLAFFTAFGLGALLWAVGYFRMTGVQRLRCAVVLCANVTVFVLVGNLWRQYLAAVFLVASVTRQPKSRFAATTLRASPMLFHVSSLFGILFAWLASLPMRRRTMAAICVGLVVPSYLAGRVLIRDVDWEVVGGYLSNTDGGWMRRLKLAADLCIMLAATRDSPLSRLAVFSSASCLAVGPDGLFGRLSHYPALAIATQFATGLEATRRAKVLAALYVVENLVGLALSATFLRALGMVPENLGI